MKYEENVQCPGDILLLLKISQNLQENLCARASACNFIKNALA